MCNYELAAVAIAAVGAGVSANEQHRAATAPKPAAPTGPAPSAQAYTSPEADPTTNQPTGRSRLRVDLTSSVPKTGVGLQVTSKNYPGVNFAAPAGVRG
jgi:hypothetical protein